MRRSAVHVVAVVLALGCVLAACAPARGEDGPPAASGDFAGLMDVGGRKLFLECHGSGGPTVVLQSGFPNAADIWSVGAERPPSVMQGTAGFTRVCAYDRAGYGFSDVGPLPRDGAAIARDLDEALRGARETGPYLVVGHSAGGMYARLFAARRKGEVIGLVLVDPTVEQTLPSRDLDGLGAIRTRVERCLASAGDPDERCQRQLGRPGDTSPEARRKAWEARLSELNEIFGRASEQVRRARPVLHDVPAYVLTASETAASAPRSLFPESRSILELQHEEMARLFRNGSQRTVFSSHLIMIDRPDTVLDAVSAMVSAHRSGLEPPPLPPSEGLPGLEEPLSPSDEPYGGSEPPAWEVLR